MTDTATRTNWDAFLFEMQGSVHRSYSSEAPFLAELSGHGDPSNPGRITRAMDGNREHFDGSQVRHTVLLNRMNAGGWPGENGTWNVPQGTNAQKIYDKLCEFVQPFSLTFSIDEDSSYSHSNASALTLLVEQAAEATAINQNIALLGDGTGLMATITDSATSLATTVTGANADVLLPGTDWDILTRSTGADPGQGLRRKIASVSWTSDSAGTITWDTAAQASDGGSGSIVHASTSGVYIPGSFSAPGTTDYLPNGLEEAVATSGTFQGLSRSTYPQWAGTDGRGGVTTTLALSEQMLMGAARRGRRSGTRSWDFAIGDPAAIDLYIQSFFAQRQFNPDTMTLKSGYSGAVFSGAGVKPFPLIGEPASPKGKVRMIPKKSIQLYGNAKGPSLLDDDGSTQRRFSRTLAKELDLVDRMNALYTECWSLVFLNNLDVAA